MRLTLRKDSTVLEYPAVMMTSLEWMWSNDCAAMFEPLGRKRDTDTLQQLLVIT